MLSFFFVWPRCKWIGVVYKTFKVMNLTSKRHISHNPFLQWVAETLFSRLCVFVLFVLRMKFRSSSSSSWVTRNFFYLHNASVCVMHLYLQNKILRTCECMVLYREQRKKKKLKGRKSQKNEHQTSKNARARTANNLNGMWKMLNDASIMERFAKHYPFVFGCMHSVYFITMLCDCVWSGKELAQKIS